ncbi:hypothetical protein DFQ28_008682 [Apophysomyces sp. BC1034]|nr:hypothetical protein DFQ30_010464 [Apophysomyces sp. BC1015]KAG0192560.1 hypothetical protein DFQ28_008682 [Apophysomyces sp. BC1034]
MSIQHALLTSLLEKPTSGYDLARRFERSIGYFWHATHQQIYRELGRMATVGWIASIDDVNDPARRKKFYQVLPAGEAELVRWVRELSDDGERDRRRMFLVKLRAAAVVGVQGLDEELLRLIEQRQVRLETYRAIEQRDFSTHASSAKQRLQHAVLRCGIHAEETWLEWAREVLLLLHDVGR